MMLFTRAAIIFSLRSGIRCAESHLRGYSRTLPSRNASSYGTEYVLSTFYSPLLSALLGAMTTLPANFVAASLTSRCFRFTVSFCYSCCTSNALPVGRRITSFFPEQANLWMFLSETVVSNALEATGALASVEMAIILQLLSCAWDGPPRRSLSSRKLPSFPICCIVMESRCVRLACRYSRSCHLSFCLILSTQNENMTNMLTIWLRNPYCSSQSGDRARERKQSSPARQRVTKEPLRT